MTRMTRKAVIGELRELKHMFQRCYGKYPTCLEEAIDYINQTPQPERKKGKWAVSVIRGNWNDEERRTCPICGKTFRNLEIANYCPNCGAPMEVEE